jgi:AraC family transcriptional regulator
MERAKSGSPQGVAHRHQAAIESVVDRMRSSVAEPLRLADMAASVHLSAFHFDRVFTEVTGVSAGAFQAALRIDAAKQRLLRTNDTITDICLGLGFESIGSFTTRFRLAVGMAPTNFRAYAQRLRTQDMAQLLAAAFAANTNASDVPGTIGGAPGGDAFVWIGMFPKGLPSDHPVSGTLRRGDGPFALAAPRDGQYRLLAAALPAVPDPCAYFESGDHLRVATHTPACVRDGKLADPAPLRLDMRPLRRSDPPILILLPMLALEDSSRKRATNPSRSAQRECPAEATAIAAS